MIRYKTEATLLLDKGCLNAAAIWYVVDSGEFTIMQSNQKVTLTYGQLQDLVKMAPEISKDIGRSIT